MGQKQSRDKLMYHYVVNGDVGGIQFLSKQGAGLEWKDKEGRTPLIVAAKDPALYEVAQTLIEMGANVNAFCKGGTPLHFAAKEGLDNTVALLLSHGANAFVKNRGLQTPLDVARKNGRNLVVREIESRVCYFAGYIRESFGPGLSDVPAPQPSSSAVIWVVVVPRSPHNPPRPPKLELVIYSTPQDAEPRKIVTLRRSKIKAPRFDHPSPSLTIFDKQTKTRYKFSSVSFNDKQQLRRLYNACKGISQVMPAAAQMMATEAINSPIHAASLISSPAWRTPRILSPPMTPNHVWVHESPMRVDHYRTGNWSATQLVPVVSKAPDRFPAQAAVSSPTPSAPPFLDDNTTILPDEETASAADTAVTPADSAVSPADSAGSTADTADRPAAAKSAACVVCWEAPVEGACVPCGHVSSCMTCLNKIKDNNEVCPVCRAEINQVVKLYGI